MAQNESKRAKINAYEKIELTSFLLQQSSIPITVAPTKNAIKDFVDAALFFKNAPMSVFYDKDIEMFNAYMWRIRDLAMDIKKSWLKRNNKEESQDDPILQSCSSIISAIEQAAFKTNTPCPEKR